MKFINKFLKTKINFFFWHSSEGGNIDKDHKYWIPAYAGMTMGKIRYLGSCFFNILYPKKCFSCGKQGGWLCQGCKSMIFFRSHQDCLVCHLPNENGLVCNHCRAESDLTAVLSAYSYKQDVIVKMIKAMKYKFVKSIAVELSLCLVDFLKSQKEVLPVGLIVVPVPLHARRHRWRGFNQSEILAESVAGNFGLLFVPNGLVRKKITKPQAVLSDEERRVNVVGIFEASLSMNWHGKKVLLVDDVVTTGSTVESCCQALKKAGAKSVRVVALVRG